MSVQTITVHGKIKVEEFGSLKEFLFLEIPKLFYVHFEPGFERGIESTSFAQIKAQSAEHYLKFRLSLNSSWISFRLEKDLETTQELFFQPHPDSDRNISNLCKFLNAFQTRLE